MPSSVTSTSAPRASRAWTWKSTGPAADAVAAHHGHESLAREVQQRPEHEHRDAVEAAERKRDLGLGLLGGGDLELAVLLGHPRTDGSQDVRRDLDVADLGDVGDGARPVPQDGGHHVLGHGVLGAVHLDVTDQGAVGLDEPFVGHGVDLRRLVVQVGARQWVALPIRLRSTPTGRRSQRRRHVEIADVFVDAYTRIREDATPSWRAR